ncbi:MAG: carbohydrate ABC transporter permease [Anaerolineae bacterium]|nr:carbohydrate ABC transporter permease [Anaerolineae bacterium]
MMTAEQANPVIARRRTMAGRAREIGAKIISYLAVLVVSLLFLIPWVWLVSTSLKTPAQIMEIPPSLVPKPIMWKNYEYAVTSIRFMHYLQNTLVICAVVLLGRVFSCTVVAYSLSHVDWVGKKILFAIVIATMMLPGQVTMIPLFIIFTKLGWIDSFLPLTVPAFFGDAFFIFMMRQFFMSIPKDLIDAARLDGATHPGIYWRVVMPLSGPALATMIAYTFIWTFTDFQVPLIYLKNRELWTLSLGMQGYLKRYGATGTAMGAMMAGATLYTLPMLVIFFVAQKRLIQGMVTTGLK